MSRAVPEGWDFKTIGDITHIRRGASPRPISDPKWFSDEGPGWVRISDVTSSFKTLKKTKQRLSPEGVEKSVLIRPGSLIMSICATIGVPIVTEIDACIHDGFVLFDGLDSSTISTEFLFYYVENLAEGFSGKGQPGTQKNINTTIVKQSPINLPPLPEQKKIAAILNSVDEAISATQAVIDQTRKVKEGLLQDLLTRGIGHTRFKQTEIGEIPEGWEVLPFGEILFNKKSLTYGILQPGPDVPDGIPMLRAVDLKDGELSGTKVLRVHPDIEREYARTRLEGDEVILSVMGTVGRSALVKNEWRGWNVNRALAVFKVSEKVSREFMDLWINSPSVQLYFEKQTIGSAQKRINLKDLRELPLPVPSPSEQDEICEHVSIAVGALKHNANSLIDLLCLKQGLMQDLLSGEVRVA